MLSLLGQEGSPPRCSLPLAAARWLRGCAARTALLSGPWHLSPPTRDRTPVPGVARRILNHWPSREVPDGCLKRSVQYFQMYQQVSCTAMGLLVSGLYVLVKPRGNERLKTVHFTVCKLELRKSDFKNTPCETQTQRAERGHRWGSRG